MQKFIIISLVLVFTACGYKPLSVYDTSGENPIFLSVKLNKVEPNNALLLRDKLRETLLHRLGIKVSNDSKLKESLLVSYDHISYHALGYDDDGYISRYRANITLHFNYTSLGKSFSKDISAFHEADISKSGVATRRIKQDAIWQASQKAIDQFIAYFASRRLHSAK